MRTHRIGKSGAAAIATAILLVAFLAVPASGQAGRPEEFEGIDITPVLGTQVPLDRPFVDERGRKVKLGDFFHEDRPVLLILAYYRCPMLCGLVLQAAADGMKEISLDAGTEYDVVVISIDPTETPQLAKLNQQKFVARYARPGAAKGIHFLVGRVPDIRAVADAVGFGYKWNEERQEYVHAAGLFILTPGGELSQCITGLEFEPKTLRFSLLAASEGKQGTILDKVLLWCHTYDPKAGTYNLAVWTLTQIFCGLTLLAVAILVVPHWVRSRRGQDEKTPTENERG